MASNSSNDKLSRKVNVKRQIRYFLHFLFVLSVLFLLVRTSERATIQATMDEPLRFLSLGDSYTIGEGIDPSQRWPVQLSAALRNEGINIENPHIVARTGWTTSDLLRKIEARKPEGPFDLVSLLIGVNNQYQGKDIGIYQQEFRTLLGLAIDFTGGNPVKVLVLSIPDWGVTPYAQGRERAKISTQIDQFNDINLQECQSAGVNYFDITSTSRQAANDATLLAPDKLHPAGKMYTAWVDLIFPQVKKILE